MTDKLKFQFELGAEPGTRREDAPMRLLLLGNFSGLAPGERSSLADRKPVRVDIDSIAKLMSAIEPQCSTSTGDIRFASLDDFHPDALYERLNLFANLREQRTRPAPSGEDSPLGALLGGKPAISTGAPASKPEGIHALIEQVIAPHIVPDTTAQDRAWKNAVDTAITDQMRQLLHDPEFQSLEANWRGADWLVSNLDCDGPLQMFVLDVSREELHADLAGPTRNSALWAAMSADGNWSSLITLFEFDGSDADVSVLASLGAIASHVGGPVIASAEAALWTATEEDEPDAWQLLRNSEVAPWIGLVAPRLLMRRPYGKRSDPVSAFPFEEFTGRAEPGHYLWAPGPLGFALLLGRSFLQEEAWTFALGDERELDDLPMATREDAHGDTELVPCAETFLSDTQAEALDARGLMVLLSHRHRSTALLHRFRSIAASGRLQGLPS